MTIFLLLLLASIPSSSRSSFSSLLFLFTIIDDDGHKGIMFSCEERKIKLAHSIFWWVLYPLAGQKSICVVSVANAWEQHLTKDSCIPGLTLQHPANCCSSFPAVFYRTRHWFRVNPALDSFCFGCSAIIFPDLSWSCTPAEWRSTLFSFLSKKENISELHLYQISKTSPRRHI